MFNWLSTVTGFMYIVLGVVVILYKFFVINLEPKSAYMLGTLFIVYGVFRTVRAIVRLRNKN